MSRSRGVDAVVFDLDGTLVDSVGDIHAAIARALADLDLPPLDLAEVRGFIGDGVPALVARVRAARNLEADRQDELQERFMAHYAAAPAALTRPYAGAAAALATLRRRGLRLGLCTNKPVAISRAIVAELDLGRCFEAIVGGDTLPQRKPHPAPLLAAVGRLRSRRPLYVGDSEIDAESAARAGLPFVLYLGGYRRGAPESIPCAATFADFADLPELVSRID